MKKIISVAAVTTLLAASAFAGETTVEYNSPDGDTATFTYNDETGTATNIETGETSPYSYDESSNKVCIETADGPDCATLINPSPEPKVGEVTEYTSAHGNGTATIKEVK